MCMYVCTYVYIYIYIYRERERERERERNPPMFSTLGGPVVSFTGAHGFALMS